MSDAPPPGHWQPPVPPPGYVAPGYVPPGSGPPPIGGGPGAPPYAYGAPPRPFPQGMGRDAGPVPLRPLALGDVLDGAFKLFRANARPLLAIAAAFVVPVQLLAGYLNRAAFGIGFGNLLSNPELAEETLAGSGAGGSQIASLVSGAVQALVQPFIAGAACALVAAAYLGQPISAGAALRAAGHKWGALTGAWWLHVLPFAVAFVPGVIFVLGAVANPALALVGVLLFLVGGLAAAALIPLWVATAPAIVTERLGPIRGLRRSWGLARSRYWPTTGKVVVTTMILWLISGIIGGVPSIIALFVGGSYAWVFAAVGGILGGLITLPLSAIIATLIYFDLRIRLEGFDLQLLAAELGSR